MICMSRTFSSAASPGSTCTCNCRRRSPQIETLATPLTPVSRGAIVQRASTDISISDSFSDDRPIIITRPADDTGLIITGDLATFGSVWTSVSRSCTICRARMMSVPGSKTSTIDDRPGIDCERISSSHGAPLSMSASSGTVIRASTSAADRPSASV